MTRREIKKHLNRALDAVQKEIAGVASGGFYARGLAGEGYAGGYRDALCDVENLLNGVVPHRRNYWDDWTDNAEKSG